MKPAIETPSGVSSDSYQKTVCCLRCEQKLQRYQLMRASLAPGAGHAILSCPRCGHVEFVADSSPLLQSLELVSVDTASGAVALRLVLESANCAECVLPRAMLEGVAIGMLQRSVPGVAGLSIDDPRDHPGYEAH